VQQLGIECASISIPDGYIAGPEPGAVEQVRANRNPALGHSLLICIRSASLLCFKSKDSVVDNGRDRSTSVNGASKVFANSARDRRGNAPVERWSATITD
jgi:hypothetical protein